MGELSRLSSILGFLKDRALPSAPTTDSVADLLRVLEKRAISGPAADSIGARIDAAISSRLGFPIAGLAHYIGGGVDTTISVNTTIANRVQIYRDLTINAGIALTVGSSPQIILARTISFGSTASIIDARGKGGAGSTGGGNAKAGLGGGIAVLEDLVAAPAGNPGGSADVRYLPYVLLGLVLGIGGGGGGRGDDSPSGKQGVGGGGHGGGRGTGGGTPGNGGAGGGLLIVICDDFITAAGQIDASGTAGAAAGEVNDGGGGGGGGGAVFLFSRAASVVPAFAANGGAGGAGAGNGVDGGNGGAGASIHLRRL